MALNPDFLGTGWSFPPTFRRRGRDLDTTSGVDDIERSLEILLSTRIGERVMQPKYGCNLDRLVFEPMDVSLLAYVKDLVETAILYFEPRIILEDIDVTPDQMQGILNISLDYRVAATNTRYNYVYPFYRYQGVEIVEPE